MPRLTRMSKKQKMFMVGHLENNKFLLQQNKLKPSELEKFTNGWKNFAVELNKLEGAEKTITQWKDALNEFKVNTRRKARLLHEEFVGTGGGPKTQKPLSELEERLMALLSKIVIKGAPNIPEGGIIGTAETTRDNNEQIIIEEYLVEELPATANPSSLNVADNANIAKTVTVLATGSASKPNTKKRPASNKNLEINLMAKNHEKCLLMLADSNNNLARAVCKRNKLERGRIRSAVFSLQF